MKYPRVNEPTPNLGNLFGSGYIEDTDGILYPVMIPKSPTQPTITVVATTDASWTPVVTGLSGVYLWRASERNGQDFRYAYVAAPGASYCTAFGALGWRTTGMAALYVQRIADDVTIEIERWSY